ncbi:hornerin-like [Penaeus japonicus]|uniref:hornerin-like n=1 Tax=Penaeus japonicus TaxID=27405 RepID=UPI001C715A02|nr:hornerin-like [Penaeus japonicus]
MRGVVRYRDPESPYAERTPVKDYRMRTDWGIYEDPGQLTGGIYSVSDVAGVGVYHEGGDMGEEGGDDNVYGFNGRNTSRLATGQWSSTHSLAATSSPARPALSGSTSGGLRNHLGESQRRSQGGTYTRDSSRHQDYQRPSRNTSVEPLYRTVDKRSSERNIHGSSRSSQRRSYTSNSRGDYGNGYRSLRSYPSTAEDYDDREPKSFDHGGISNGYSSRSVPEYSSRSHDNLKRSSSKDYLSSSEIYGTRKSYPSETPPKGILTNTGKYGGGSRSSLTASNYTSGSRSNLAAFGSHDDKADLSGSEAFEKRGSSSLPRASHVLTSTKGSQTELSLADDLKPLDGRGSSKSSLQVPDAGGSASSRHSSSSTQQVSFSTGTGGASDSSQYGGKDERKYDSLSRKSGEKRASDKGRKAKGTKDEQNQTDDEMSQWGGHNGGPGQWHDRDAYYQQDQHHPHAHGRLAPPLPRPPMPPQHYPGHDGQTHPNHTHHSQHASDHSSHPSHNHAYHSHGANHAHHPQHSRHQSSSGSTRQLVHAESTEGECSSGRAPGTRAEPSRLSHGQPLPFRLLSPLTDLS